MVPHPTGYSRAAGIARFRCVASLLARRRGCLGGDRGRRLLAGPDLRRHPVLRVERNRYIVTVLSRGPHRVGPGFLVEQIY